MATLKLFHILFLFIWLGSLLAVSTLLGYFAKGMLKEIGTRFRPFYLFVELPAMVLAIAFGVVLAIKKGMDMKAGWCHMKFTFAALLIFTDLYLGSSLLKGRYTSSKRYKIIQALALLFIIGVLVAVYIFKARCIIPRSIG